MIHVIIVLLSQHGTKKEKNYTYDHAIYLHLLILVLSIVKLFLEAIDDHISQCAVLVLLCPTNISGKIVVEEKDVFRYEPSPSR